VPFSLTTSTSRYGIVVCPACGASRARSMRALIWLGFSGGLMSRRTMATPCGWLDSPDGTKPAISCLSL
jgi:hypothetical protein